MYLACSSNGLEVGADARHDVGLDDGGEVVHRLRPRLLRQAHRLFALDLLDEVSDGAAVGGSRRRVVSAAILKLLACRRLHLLKRHQQQLHRLCRELHLRLPDHILADLHEFLAGVVLKVQPGGEAAGQPAVGLHERAHLLLIPSEDHHQVVTVVFHHFEDGVNGLAAKGVALPADQAVGLVHKQDAPEGALAHLLRLHRRLPGVPRHQHRAVHLDELAAT
mmetsp:Transcript_5815/g.10098  ORF Transcript_5815/g.10098 Transcript_5815/m.10098 type:complete len:221 (+) Transcript_5815:77-739(+)